MKDLTLNPKLFSTYRQIFSLFIPQFIIKIKVIKNNKYAKIIHLNSLFLKINLAQDYLNSIHSIDYVHSASQTFQNIIGYDWPF